MAPGARDQPGRAAPAQSRGRWSRPSRRHRSAGRARTGRCRCTCRRGGSGAVEHEVARRELVLGDVREARVLRSRGVREPHAGRGPRVHREPGAVERARADAPRTCRACRAAPSRCSPRSARRRSAPAPASRGADGVEPLAAPSHWPSPARLLRGRFLRRASGRRRAPGPLRPPGAAPRSARRAWRCRPARRRAAPAARPARPRSRRGSTRATPCAPRRRPSSSRTRRGRDSSCSLATVRSPMRSWSSSAAAEPYFDRLESSETSPTSSTSAGPPFAAPT